MIFFALAVVVVTMLVYIYCDYRKCLPGPWNLPIIGYLHKLDPLSPYLTLTELAYKYGPIYRVKFGFADIAVIGEEKLLKKILMKDEALGRPPFFILHVVAKGKGIGNSPPPVWKDLRRFTNQFLKMVGAAKFSSNKKQLEKLITNHAEDFVHHVQSQGDRVTLDLSDALAQYVTSIAGAILLGKPFSRHDQVHKDLMHDLDMVMNFMQLGGPLNFLPFLRFLPKYRKTLRTLTDTMDKVRTLLGKYISECEKKCSNDGTATNLIEAFLLQRSKGSPEEIYNVDQLNYLLFDLFIATTETTSVSILWTMKYLAHYQEVQEKVRQELFDVLQGRTFEMSDLPKLSYTQATITEVARIRTVIPLGFPHYAIEDIYIDDYKITKGTTIMSLLWAIHMDPKVWDKPEEFRPDRFLNEEKMFVPTESVLPFQYGKRMCIRDEFARMIIYIFFSGLLKNFRLEPSGCLADFSGVCGLSLVPKAKEIVFVKI